MSFCRKQKPLKGYDITHKFGRRLPVGDDEGVSYGAIFYGQFYREEELSKNS